MHSAVVFSLILFAAFTPRAALAKQRPSAAAASNHPLKHEVLTLDQNDFDLSTRAEDDFYQYANGGWLRRTTIPDYASRWGGFEILEEAVTEQLRQLADGAVAAHAKPGSVTQKVADFYLSGLDDAGRHAAGIEALMPLLSQIDAVGDARAFAEVVAVLQQVGAAPLFSFGASPDAKNSNLVIAQYRQGGMGLPTRDYYFDTSKKAETLRAAYVDHVTHMLALADVGIKDALSAAQRVLAVETELARNALSEEARRDPIATYNPMDMGYLTQLAPTFAWDAYFLQQGIDPKARISVESPSYLTGTAQLTEHFDWPTWRIYLKWHLLNALAPYLTAELEAADFAFYGTVLDGVKSLKPLYRRVLGTLNAFLGEPMGQLYVEAHFGPERRAQAHTVLTDVSMALKKSLQTNTWMAPSTRAQALAKIERIIIKVGYPDKWVDYAKVRIGRSYIDNVMACHAFLFARELGYIGKPPDRARWQMVPQMVNAYYDPQANEIVFPAAILQPPFFNAEGDMAFNYGAVGAVVGHEMTHGYDDQGRLFDVEGNMVDWWTPLDAKRFLAETANIIKQYNQYTVFGSHVNGALTQGENIADLGGVRLAFGAMQMALARGEVEPERQGFSAAQRFFLAWAQVWRNQIRQENAERRLKQDPHSPGIWRVNGPLANMPEFYEAFGVSQTDGMYRPAADRVNIWQAE